MGGPYGALGGIPIGGGGGMPGGGGARAWLDPGGAGGGGTMPGGAGGGMGIWGMPVEHNVTGTFEGKGVDFNLTEQTCHLSQDYLDACFLGGTGVVLVEVHHHQPVDLVPLHLEAYPLKEALLEALIQEEEQGGNQEAACLHRKFHSPVSMSYSISTQSKAKYSSHLS